MTVNDSTGICSACKEHALIIYDEELEMDISNCCGATIYDPGSAIDNAEYSRGDR